MVKNKTFIKTIHNHIAPPFSQLEWDMVRHIPPGGNWKNIPDTVPSKRLEQIRRSGGRTTYYGRLQGDKPSYTISTYFNRIGNGCYIHPDQDRLISIREAARLQSFRDSFVFCGTKTSQYKQVGNAVPPLLARAVAETIEPYLKNKTFIDLFAGAGGMSEGFLMQGYSLLGAIEIEKFYFETYVTNHNLTDKNHFILGDITEERNKRNLISIKKKAKVGVVIGGPPCQGFSHAGWRNPHDERNKLFLDFVELVNEIRPEIFVLENVPGILSMRKGEAIKEIISCFEEIGYHMNMPILLKAEHFGVPQLRRRVFIIGSLTRKDIPLPKPLFTFNRLKEKTQPYETLVVNNLPPAVNVNDAIDGLPEIRAGGGEMEMKAKICVGSDYEELLNDMISFKSFYCSRMKHYS